MNIFYAICFFIVGSCLGSFACAQVWRMRAKQIVLDKSQNKKVDEAEYKRLSKLVEKNGKFDRSIDLDTGKQLKWFELIPIFSWIILRGKSRYTGKKIGYTEILSEIIMGILFAGSYLLWPVKSDIVGLIVWLICLVGFWMILIYDAKWSLIPDNVSNFLIIMSAISSIVFVFSSGKGNITANLFNLLWSAIILSGVYFIICLLSKEKMIGLGDVKVGLAEAFLLHKWYLAFIALFSANLMGTFFVLPGMIARKIGPKSKIPFAPFLILGMILAQLVGENIFAWYMHLIL